MTFTLTDFIRESNRIEGILREPTEAEIDETKWFLSQPRVTVLDLCNLVSVFAPGHRLRDVVGINVRVGNHIAPAGGPEIRTKLQDLLDRVNNERIKPWQAHIEYETLHPFSDGNGRSGRALWLWQMTKLQGGAPLGFLHSWYYMTLENVGR